MHKIIEKALELLKAINDEMPVGVATSMIDMVLKVPGLVDMIEMIISQYLQIGGLPNQHVFTAEHHELLKMNSVSIDQIMELVNVLMKILGPMLSK